MKSILHSSTSHSNLKLSDQSSILVTTISLPLLVMDLSFVRSTGRRETMAEQRNHPRVSLPKVILFVCDLFQIIADTNDHFAHPLSPHNITVFHGETRPTISIHSYLEWIYTYSNCSISSFILAFIYLERYCQRHPSVFITNLNVHRLLLASVVVSVKFLEDMWVFFFFFFFIRRRLISSFVFLQNFVT